MSDQGKTAASDSTVQHSRRVAAIVVTYRPDAARLGFLFRRLAPQVDRIFVIDNSGTQSPQHSGSELSNHVFVPLGRNVGIAAAQNIGAKKPLKPAPTIFC